MVRTILEYFEPEVAEKNVNLERGQIFTGSYKIVVIVQNSPDMADIDYLGS